MAVNSNTSPSQAPGGLGNETLFSCSFVTSQPLCSCCMLYNCVSGHFFTQGLTANPKALLLYISYITSFFLCIKWMLIHLRIFFFFFILSVESSLSLTNDSQLVCEPFVEPGKMCCQMLCFSQSHILPSCLHSLLIVTKTNWPYAWD